MARKLERRAIDGETYELNQLGAVEGRRVYIRLVKTLSPALSALAENELTERGIARALANAINSLDEETVSYLCDVFGRHSRIVRGDKAPKLEEAVFDEHFVGRYLHMTRWLVECIRFNFDDFLELFGDLKGAMEGFQLRFQQTSTGSSGES